jgi:hypothetical protein
LWVFLGVAAFALALGAFFFATGFFFALAMTASCFDPTGLVMRNNPARKRMEE